MLRLAHGRCSEKVCCPSPRSLSSWARPLPAARALPLDCQNWTERCVRSTRRRAYRLTRLQSMGCSWETLPTLIDTPHLARVRTGCASHSLGHACVRTHFKFRCLVAIPTIRDTDVRRLLGTSLSFHVGKRAAPRSAKGTTCQGSSGVVYL